MENEGQLGPFEIGRRVGEGGMGVVHRAHHVETGEPVAVKVLLAETARDPEKRRDFRREVQALAKLHHPGIARILDYGEVGSAGERRSPEAFWSGAPWFAMEYVAGRPMPKTASGWRWEQLQSTLLAVLDALAHAHARSIVHRDLKPGNMLIDETASGGGAGVKIVDFGIARIFESKSGAGGAGRDRTRVTGTPTYMAPEQILGEWRDQGPWTDLYALGCLAWRLASGTAPFEGDTTEDVLERQVQSIPPEFDPVMAVPPGLETWLRGLLRKDVARRTRFAADAARELMELGEPEGERGEPRDAGEGDSIAPTIEDAGGLQTIADTAVDTSPDAPLGSTRSEGRRDDGGRAAPSDGSAPGGVVPPVPSDWKREAEDRRAAVVPKAGLELFGLREVPVVGREGERDRLWAALDRVADREEPELVALEAGTGAGKTRLAEWLCRRANEVGAARVLQASHGSSSGPDAGLREMVRRTYRTDGLSRGEVYERLWERLPQRATDDAMHDHDVRALTELLRPTGDSEAVEGPRYRFSSAAQKFGLMHRFFERLAARRPLVVWFDDLQWGRGSIGVLEELFSPSGTAPPVLAVATVRSDLVAERSALEEWLKQLWERADARRIELSPLDADDHRELIDRLLDLAPGLADRLAERTEGNPLFAIELLRDWVDRGVLEPGDRGFELVEGVAVEIPDDIHWLWIDRLDELVADVRTGDGEEVWRALELGATLGREVDTAEWEAVLDDAGLEPAPALTEQLFDRGLASPTAGGWRFAHGLLVEALRRRSRERGRAPDHHRRCARMLEGRLDDEIGPRERLADHWIRAGSPGRALEPLLEEFEMSRERGGDEQRRRLLEKRREALDRMEVADDDPRHLENTIRKAGVIADTRDLDRAESILSEVWETLDASMSELQGRTALRLSSVASRQGDGETSKQWAEEGVEAARRADAVVLECRCVRRLGWAEIFASNLERAEEYVDRQIELAERADHPSLELRGRRARAWIWKIRGEERARRAFEQLRREAAEKGFLRIQTLMLNDLGEWARERGDLDEARRYHTTRLRKSKELSRPHEPGTAHLNLALVEFEAGRFDDVLEHLESAERIWRAAGAGARWEGVRHLIRLGRAVGIGDREGFAEYWSAVSDGWPEGWRIFEDHGQLLETTARYALDAGWREEARSVARRARQIWEEIGDEEAVARICRLIDRIDRVR